ncbi:MAG: hypothetical protein P1V34_15975 [Alphaproteobacteria bacterium]|nr:hypothetical protein [Alphaproteobacteria bacterium]
MPSDPTPSPEDKSESVIRSNRGIVIVVATLGALIIFAVGGLIYGIMTKSGKHSDASPTQQTQAVPISPAIETAPATTGAAQILGISSQENRLYLHIRTQSGRDVVRIYDQNGMLITELEP